MTCHFSSPAPRHRRTSPGFTLLEILMVVGIIGLLAALAIPGFVHARNTSNKNVCLSNLRQIDSAKQEWGLELNKKDGDTPLDTDLDPYLRLHSIPSCPGNGTYDIGSLGESPTCTFLGHTF